jgi:hypothetical protein
MYILHYFSTWFNPELLTVIDTSSLTPEVGDLVQVINCYKTVRALQDDEHGGWNEEMRQVTFDLFSFYI